MSKKFSLDSCDLKDTIFGGKNDKAQTCESPGFNCLKIEFVTFDLNPYWFIHSIHHKTIIFIS